MNLFSNLIYFNSKYLITLQNTTRLYPIMNKYINYFLNYLQTEKDAAKFVSSLGKTSHNELE